MWHFTLLVEAVPKAHPGPRREGVDPTTQWKEGQSICSLFVFHHLQPFDKGTVQILFLFFFNIYLLGCVRS